MKAADEGKIQWLVACVPLTILSKGEHTSQPPLGGDPLN